MQNSHTQLSGAGIGLRSAHYTRILEQIPDVPWFEALTENYFGDGGMPLYYLEKIRDNYPISFHGVGMSLASADPLNLDYMRKLKSLLQRFQPLQVSDHLSWVSSQQRYTHELLPFPYNSQTLKSISDKVGAAQDFLGMPILVENPSSYMQFKHSDMQEWDFINQLTANTGCKVLLDMNNVYVSAYNIGLDAVHYIQHIDYQHVGEIHLAGFEQHENYLFDTHGDRISTQVWDLYQRFIQRAGAIPTLIEWDTDIPEFSVLQSEAAKAQRILQPYLAQNHSQFNHKKASMR